MALFLSTVMIGVLICMPVHAEERISMEETEKATVETEEPDTEIKQGEVPNVETETEKIEESVEETAVLEIETEIPEESETVQEKETEEKEDLKEARDPVEAFVERLYKDILNRNPDPSGLKAWTDVLKSGKEQGAKVAQGFVDSKEMRDRNLSDDAYIRALYKAFFDREADAAGLNAWKKVLDSGLSRLHVFRGFAESNEFTEICSRYGIVRGSADLTAPMDQNEGVTKFIYRCYLKFLGRKADTAGLNAWTNALLSSQNNAKEAAYGFVMSNEFQGKGLSNADYVKTLYLGLFDRDPDNSGLASWVEKLEGGMSRESVFYGFADSQEFRQLASAFGLSDSWVSTVIPEDVPAEVLFKRIYTRDFKEYAIITAKDAKGNVMWKRTTGKYNQLQFDSTSEIGLRGNVYYYAENKTVYALSANTGDVLWSNADFGGYQCQGLIGKDGTLYLNGKFEPALCVISPDGKTLARYEDFDGNAIDMSSMEFQDGNLVMKFASDTANIPETIYTTYYVNLSTLQWSAVR